MWSSSFEKLPGGNGMRGVVHRGRAPASYEEVIRALESDDLRSVLTEALASLPYRAYKWETPPVTRANCNRPFEFVVLDRPELDRPADPAPFAEHFTDDATVVEFSSLGGDALLIAPCPRAPLSAYPHLASFLRQGPEEQVQALWQRVGQVIRRRVGDRPVWLSTAGEGVAWLHVRLDDRPKYFGHEAYRRA